MSLQLNPLFLLGICCLSPGGLDWDKFWTLKLRKRLGSLFRKKLPQHSTYLILRVCLTFQMGWPGTISDSPRVDLDHQVVADIQNLVLFALQTPFVL